jgi:asparagine synthetase B (glutamine-hydrolysing)
MCGIAVVVGADPREDGVLIERLRCLDHRAPDTSGVFRRGAGTIGQWSASGLRVAYRSIGDGGLWLQPSRRHGDRSQADEAAS